MKAKNIVGILIIVSLLAGTVSAVSPHDWSYGLHRGWEGINYAFQFNEEARIRTTLEYANRRMGEMDDTDDVPTLGNLQKDVERELAVAEEKTNRMQNGTNKQEFAGLIETQTTDNIRVLERVRERIQDMGGSTTALDAALVRSRTALERREEASAGAGNGNGNN